MSKRSSIIYKDKEGVYVVDLIEDGVLRESRKLPGFNQYYAQDVSDNWDSGIIQLELDK